MIAKNVPYKEYARMPGINISALKEIGRSPLHYKHRADHPYTSEAMALGTATHTAVLEPHKFMGEYALWERRTEAGAMAPRRGKEWDKFCDENKDRTILTPNEYNLAQAMRDAVRGYPAAMRYLRQGDAEVSMSWTDQGTGMLCRGRLDWLAEVDGHPVLVGLKTARDCRHIQFGRQAANLGYHLQWAFYLDGYRQITGKDARVVEIVVESEAPHECRVYRITEDILAAGRDEYHRLLAVLKDCEEHDHWPPAVDVEEDLTLPNWVYGNDEGDLEDLGISLGETA